MSFFFFFTKLYKMRLALLLGPFRSLGTITQSVLESPHKSPNGSLAWSQALSQASGNSNLKVSCIRGSDWLWKRDRLSWFITASAFSTFKRWSGLVASSREQYCTKWETSEPGLTRKERLDYSLNYVESTSFFLEINLQMPQNLQRGATFSTPNI